MKKILIAATAVLCFTNSSFSQENAGGSNASHSAQGQLNDGKIVASAVGVAILGAVIANNRGSTTIIPPDPGGPTVPCEAGEELVDGQCVPVTTTTTVTTTVTATSTVTSTVAPPVTVTTTTTL